MEYNEEDYLQLSGIQHYVFCKRQWEENLHTTEGNLLHKKVHNPFSYEKRGEVLTVRGLRIYSRQLGFSGECDAVEFHEDSEGTHLSGHRGLYRPYPVEYKKGSPKTTDADILQCVWKRCSVSPSVKELFIMERFGEEKMWSSMMP